jgi:hypothetical protein
MTLPDRVATGLIPGCATCSASTGFRFNPKRPKVTQVVNGVTVSMADEHENDDRDLDMERLRTAALICRCRRAASDQAADRVRTAGIPGCMMRRRVDIISLTRRGVRAAAAPTLFTRPRTVVAQVDDEGTQEKWNATLASVAPQHSLHATQADAVALGQSSLRGARAAVPKKVEDALLAKAINQPPTTRCLRRRGWLAVVAVDPCGELANRRHHRPYFGVRETSP